MSFPPDVKEGALVASGRHCCLCHRFCGLKIELHHIIESASGGQDDFDNCIPLCFDCHADMRSYDHKHPKGTKYSPSELRRHRDTWYSRVSATASATMSADSVELDRVTFKRLLKLLPWDGSVAFMRTEPFAGAGFTTDSIQDLDALKHASRDPAFEFLDADLESLRTALLQRIREFLNVVSENTFAMDGQPGRVAVPAGWKVGGGSQFRDAVRAIVQGADNVCETYDQLVRLGRRRLGVPGTDAN